VLNGVLYRGGANNVFNKNKVRDNRNPLPAEGLMNLCKEGFRNVFYMYTTNYDKKTNPVKCKTDRGPDNKLEINMSYLQKGPWDRKTQYEILKAVYDNITNPNAGPLYIHCWNGWHASGLVSSFALRQFCNYTGSQAVKYWDTNTDGNNKGKSYNSYRSQIQNFIQFDDLKLTDKVMKQICFAPLS
jgi:protein tyrosine/serine phosphatase